MDVFFIAHFIEFHFRVPDFHGACFALPGADVGWGFLAGLDVNNLAADDAQVEDFLRQLEHAVEHLVDGEEGPQFLFIKIILRFALPFTPEGDFPRLE